jgi:hypothetical protein
MITTGLCEGAGLFLATEFFHITGVDHHTLLDLVGLPQQPCRRRRPRTGRGNVTWDQLAVSRPRPRAANKYPCRKPSTP